MKQKNLEKTWLKKLIALIHIPLSVYQMILKSALSEGNPYISRKNWKEVVGVLVGRIGEDIIEVTDSIFLGSGTAVFVEAQNYSAITTYLPFERIEKGESIVAWWHSHPGLGLFLSGTDVQTQSAYQKLDSRAFALVIDPLKITPKNPGIAIFRVDEHDYSYFDIDFLVEPRTNYQLIKDNVLAEILREKELPIIKIVPSLLSPAILERVEIAVSCHLTSNSKYELIIKRSGEPDKFLGVSYGIKTTNLTLLTNWLSESFIHRCTEEGTLALLRFMKPNKGTGEIRLENIIVWNSAREIQKFDQCNIVISD
ncbi:MAG: Mov34/MPN/PAD-1 family protein [Promethearchaeota archaeon]